jgi:hypothetical protein
MSARYLRNTAEPHRNIRIQNRHSVLAHFLVYTTANQRHVSTAMATLYQRGTAFVVPLTFWASKGSVFVGKYRATQTITEWERGINWSGRDADLSHLVLRLRHCAALLCVVKHRDTFYTFCHLFLATWTHSIHRHHLFMIDFNTVPSLCVVLCSFQTQENGFSLSSHELSIYVVML